MAVSQELFNLAIAIAGSLGGWWMKTMWDSIKDLQETDKTIAAKIASIEVLVAGDYVRKDEFERSFSAIFKKLDRIEDKLDHKVDKN